MKKILCFVTLCGSLGLGAQILNPGFESVTNGKPDNYNTNSYSTYFIRDTSDANTGSHAAFIKGFGGQSYTIQGAVLGIFQISGKPVGLKGWYKCNIVPGDTLAFTPYVYQSTVNSPNTMGYLATTTSSAVYKQFSAPINYSSFPYSSVGTLFVSIYLSGTNTDAQGVVIPQTGTWAIIDDLSLDTVSVATGIRNNETNITIDKIYPQPSTSVTYMEYSLQSSANCSLQLFDVTGREVKKIFANEQQTEGRYKAEINVSDLNAGVYFAKLSVNGEARVARIVRE